LFEIILIFLLLIANGVFAMAEIAVVSARNSRLEPLARQGNRAARAALDLIESPNSFLSTIQIGITLIGVLAGAVSGASLAARLAPVLAQVPWLAPYSQAVSLGIIVTLVTYFSLVIGELVPKRLALNNPEGISMRIALPMQGLALLARPLVRLLSLSTELALRLLRVERSTAPPVTEEELKSLLEQGAEVGVFERAEQRLVGRALDLDDWPVTVLMTPRSDITWLDVDASPAEIRRKVIASGFSRLPVADHGLDHVIGFVRIVDLLPRLLEGEKVELQENLLDPVFIPESATPAEAVRLFQQTRLHSLLVIDEYGGIMGLVTPTDILEFIVGQLPTLEPTDPPVVQRDDGSWLVDGRTPIHELSHILASPILSRAFDSQIQTVNGLVMLMLGHIPVTGEVFEVDGLRWEVVDMDRNRVDKVLLSRVEDADSGTAEA
jgi:putative hemolysin